MRRPAAIGLGVAALLLPSAVWSAPIGLTSSSLTVAAVPAPSLYAAAVRTIDDRGGGRGKIDQGDSTLLTYAGSLRASSICSGWTNTPGPQSVGGLTVRLLDGAGATGNDVVTVDLAPVPGCGSGLRLGRVDTGTALHVTAGGVDFTGSTATLTWSTTSATVALVFGTRTAPVANPGVATSLTWTPEAAVTVDTNGFSIARGTAAGPTAVQW